MSIKASCVNKSVQKSNTSLLPEHTAYKTQPADRHRDIGRAVQTLYIYIYIYQAAGKPPSRLPKLRVTLI